MRPSVKRQSDLLDLWDEVASTPAAWRALALAAHFGGEAATAHTPIGERDRVLLVAYRRLFARRLDLTAQCPACSEQVSFEVALESLLSADTGETSPLTVVHGATTLLCRRPDTLDLVAAWQQAGSLEEARLRLCAACLGRDADAPLPDPGCVDAVSTALAEADPLADISFRLTCPTCAFIWAEGFDPARALWRALERWAADTMEDVWQLARSYGWSERDILAMDPHRRRRYLELAA